MVGVVITILSGEGVMAVKTAMLSQVSSSKGLLMSLMKFLLGVLIEIRYSCI